MARKKKGGVSEEHPSEAWLVPYADILTLLLALFIVLFANSQTDQQKMQEMAQAFSAAFQSGGPSIFDKSGPASTHAADVPVEEDQNMAYIKENNQLSETKEEIDKLIQEQGLGAELDTVLSEDGLSIRIKDTALFPSGSAELLERSQQIAAPIAMILSRVPQKVVVSGHTDNVPISNAQYRSNWDLSSQRSLNFMKFLMEQAPLKPERFMTVGYAEYRPVAANDSDENRAKNRRVEILLMRSNPQPAAMQTLK
jgi:chemotaxis protein MotB